MISEEVLRLAVDRATITAAQAAALRDLAGAGAAPEPRSWSTPEPSVDDEALRFVGGFADVFVTIGIGLFLAATYSLIGFMSAGPAQSASVAVAAWLLAEFFTRRRRMALPSIVLLVVFLAAGFATMLSGLDGAAASIPQLLLERASSFAVGVDGMIAALGTLVLAVLHYRRFRVPITIAGGTAALWLAIAAMVLSIPDLPGWIPLAMLFVFGVLTFLFAMHFDLADPARRTRRTDIAFWLHLLASPLIVHSLIGSFLGGRGAMTPQGAGLVLAVFVLLGMLAIVVDRRAMLVSGLIYAGYASGTLIETFGLAHSSVLLPTVLFLLGAFIILVSAGWQPLRRMLLRLLPTGLAARLPHPLVLSSP